MVIDVSLGVWRIEPRKLQQKGSFDSHTIRNKQKKLLSTTEKQLKSWVEYFSDVLNRPPSEKEIEIIEAEHFLPLKYNPEGKLTR